MGYSMYGAGGKYLIALGATDEEAGSQADAAVAHHAAGGDALVSVGSGPGWRIYGVPSRGWAPEEIA